MAPKIIVPWTEGEIKKLLKFMRGRKGARLEALACDPNVTPEERAEARAAAKEEVGSRLDELNEFFGISPAATAEVRKHESQWNEIDRLNDEKDALLEEYCRRRDEIDRKIQSVLSVIARAVLGSNCGGSG